MAMTSCRRSCAQSRGARAGRMPARCRRTSARGSARSAPRCCRRRVAPRVLDDEQRAGRRPAAPAASSAAAARRRRTADRGRPGRTRSPPAPRRPRRKSCADNSIAVARRRSARRFASMSATARAIPLDERHVRGAAAERLDADRAGPGVAVEHPRARIARREDVEQRLAQPVGRRPQPLPVGRSSRRPFSCRR